MPLPVRFLACAGLAVMASACATFGTNVEGSFQCRAPKGDCAPSHVLDARATSAMTNTHSPQHNGMQQPAMPVTAGDQARTSERTLKIVFPARVDEAGTLHDEAVAWAVIENPRWAAELRRKPGDEPAPPLMRQLQRQLKRQLKAAQAPVQTVLLTSGQAMPALPADNMDAARIAPSPRSASGAEVPFQAFPNSDPFSLVSPPASPSTAREAATGADAPVAGGFHAPVSLHDRTPRLSDIPSRLGFPSSDAIEAAKRDAAASNKLPQEEQK